MSADRPSARPTTRMQCMEIWGGNREMDAHRHMTGLDAWVYSKPYGGAVGGGDLYYLSSCASGRITRMLLADVSGHGSAASGLATSLRTLMRKNVNRISQRSLVQSMNCEFAAVAARSCFATAVVATYFAPSRTLSISNAGHPHPLFYHRQTNAWSLLDCDEAHEAVANTPLGIFTHADYSDLTVEFDDGDMLLCFSDSLLESLQANGKQIGMDGILQIVKSLTFADAGDLIPQLCNTIASQHHDNLSADDTSVILLRANASQPSIRDNLAAPLRMLGAVRDRTTVDHRVWDDNT